jgi:hypothetical protein
VPAVGTTNEQVIEAAVSGPDGANRLLTCTGQAYVGIWLSPNQRSQATWTFLVGPALPRPQFHRATATATIAGYAISHTAANNWHSIQFVSVEADWDDESGRTEMRVELDAQAGPGTSLSISTVGFSATILAEIPAA